MTDYSKFRKAPDQIDWMRAPQAIAFQRELGKELGVAFKNLIATCEKSTDPKVTAAITRWRELDGLVSFLGNSRKESVAEDD